jgi:cobalt-zinc-cadmium efflux system outer membrane protein
MPPGEGGDVLGGRVGTAFPRVSTAITNPSYAQQTQPRAPVIVPPPALTPPPPAGYGQFELPTGPEAEGPPNGMTLDMAIERLKQCNLDIRSRAMEIPQAKADELTASLRANPILYADSQLIPYGSFNNRRLGGPTQYDLNITHPLDLNHKRWYRVDVAVKATRVLEAQLQDYVRLQIANVYVAFVDVLASRETLRYARVRVEGLKELEGVYRKLYERAGGNKAEVDRAETLRQVAELMLESEQNNYASAKQTLGTLLHMSPSEIDALEIRGSIQDLVPDPPEQSELVQAALRSRPDLLAWRCGIQRAEADVGLAKKNRFQDIFLLFQPYTFQNNAPFGKESAHSWAVGVTVPLPLYNRNQGVIMRNLLNVSQTKIELNALEYQVANEVTRAYRDYMITRKIVKGFETGPIQQAKAMRDHYRRLFVTGETTDVVPYLNAEKDYNDILRQYTDQAIRHRRFMLNLNTAVGQRVLP